MAKAEIDTDNLGAAIGAAVAQGIAAIAPRREMKEGDPEYVARQHAEGWFDAFDNGVVVLQNAYEAQARGLSAEVRHRAAHLRPGAYLKNRVKVTVENDGAVVRLAYPVKGDAMLINRDYFTSFSDLVNKIWDEMHAA
jgi:hypothetical protein